MTARARIEGRTMGVSTQDIFGAGARPEPATPGSYGEAPQGRRLPAATRLGPVRLAVADLARSLAYYRQVLGLRLLRQDAGTAELGPHGQADTLVVLEEQHGLRPVPRGRLGLFHFAILLPDRPSLGRFVRHLGETGVQAGAGDHLVSEAFYLHDPDNLGIEVYADRPRGTWRRVGRQLMMATDPVDVEALLEAAGDARWTGMPAGTVMGHVHLHVGDLAAGAAFYSEALGFDRTAWDYPGALFMAAGGYHHHLGTNTWAGRHAIPAQPTEARLLEWTIRLPAADDVAAIERGLTGAGYAAEPRGEAAIVTHDPWGSQVRIAAA